MPSHVFPVRLGSGTNTRFLLHNLAPEPVRLSLFLYFGEARSSHMLGELLPNEFETIDLAQVQKGLVVGQGG